MIDFKFIEHHDNRKLGNLIKRHKLYEKTHRCSRFNMISEDLLADDVVSIMGSPSNLSISHFSTIVCKVDNKPVGLLIFENYVVDPAIKTNFILNRKKRSYTMLGFVGTYVDPEFRNQGIAREMMAIFNKHIELKFKRNERQVYMLSAMSTSLNIAEKECPFFLTVSSPYNSNFWKQKAKDFFTYNAISLAESALA